MHKNLVNMSFFCVKISFFRLNNNLYFAISRYHMRYCERKYNIYKYENIVHIMSVLLNYFVPNILTFHLL